MAEPKSNIQLIVFSDDWARHPSSCQHLVGRLLPKYPVLWVNTIGMRLPRFTAEDFLRAAGKIKQWCTRGKKRGNPTNGRTGDAIAGIENLTVINPRMYPGFRKNWQRQFNVKQIVGAINQAIGPKLENVQRVALTTLPITAELVNVLEVDRWIYYCVDDFSVWPGLDHEIMQDMESQMVEQADQVVAVSDILVKRMAQFGCHAKLLTHGVDLDLWSQARLRVHLEAEDDGDAGGAAKLIFKQIAGQRSGPVFMFWGLIDPRLDVAWCRQLVDRLPDCSLVLLGPTQNPSPALTQHPRIFLPGPVPYRDLPKIAMLADVLVMPYANLPVTQAMQPLKFKEYLATGKPVISRKLAATQSWADCADLVDDVDAFVQLAKQRAASGLPSSQALARQVLTYESWQAKSRWLDRLICAA